MACEARNHGVPARGVPFGHPIEYAPCSLDIPALCVHINQPIQHEIIHLDSPPFDQLVDLSTMLQRTQLPAS
ncbi:hypothetical protein C4D60_Mb07t04160 [Musa balbisiana]|uniref:Uncharacterized protein n=1 Tax=Musa balbisiana TaxID=52838 RepID=A0A4V4H6E5_MUSBA|nr:hypothetical protein C4D60_Mb07t04160 [Musa balbisiana]